MLKFKYASQDEIPEEYRGLYTEVGGEWVLTGVSGIKTQEDIERLQESLRKEREDHKKSKDTLRAYQSIGDPEEVQAELDKLDEYKAAAEGKMDDDKINQLVESRIKSRTAPLERQITKLTEERDGLQSTVGEFETKDKRRTIHDDIRKAATGAKVRDTALDDIMMYDNLFEINELGKVVTKDSVGVTPGVEASVWLTEAKQNKPHWWPESQGAGARGGDGQSGAANPFSAESWNLTEQGKLVQQDRIKAEQMAKSAGTTLGGQKPAAKGK